MTRIAVLDDWQIAAQSCADWKPLQARAEVVFFDKPFVSEDEAAAKLSGFDVLVTMRERSPFPASLVARLPNLKLFSMMGMRATTIDFKALSARGIPITYTAGADNGASTAELTLALILAAVRRVPAGDAAMRRGGFLDGIPAGFELHGKTLGLVGLGKLGGRVAGYGRALQMDVIGWSPNLTPEKAAAAGATAVSKEELFSRADVISLHLVLSDRSRGVIGADDLGRMKKGAVIVNTSRGPLVQESALIAALKTGNIIAALDVYDREPLQADHPFRTLPNTVLTPHIGYGTTERLSDFYEQAVKNVTAWLDGRPINMLQVDPATGQTSPAPVKA
jgi:phosphoglycerate dehydrogenase-like enzyme